MSEKDKSDWNLHFQELKRIEKKYSTQLTHDELQLRQLWRISSMEKSLKSISKWVTFFGILQIIAIVVAFYILNN